MDLMVEKQKQLNALIKEIEDREILLYNENTNKYGITKQLIKKTMVDLAFGLAYNEFKEFNCLSLKNIGRLANECAVAILQGTDMWQSIYLLAKINNKYKVDKKYIENHNEIYYEVGGSFRDLLGVRELLLLVSDNISNEM